MPKVTTNPHALATTGPLLESPASQSRFVILLLAMLLMRPTALLLLLLGGACASAWRPQNVPARSPTQRLILTWTIDDWVYEQGSGRDTERVAVYSDGTIGQIEVEVLGARWSNGPSNVGASTWVSLVQTPQLRALVDALRALRVPDNAPTMAVDPHRSPATTWTICVPTEGGERCAALPLSEWAAMEGAGSVFALVKAMRDDCVQHGDRFNRPK